MRLSSSTIKSYQDNIAEGKEPFASRISEEARVRDCYVQPREKNSYKKCDHGPVIEESKVDYSKSSNLVMTSVIMIIGLSGAKISFGAFSVQGMVLATLVAIIMSLLFKLFAKLNLLNE